MNAVGRASGGLNIVHLFWRADAKNQASAIALAIMTVLVAAVQPLLSSGSSPDDVTVDRDRRHKTAVI